MRFNALPVFILLAAACGPTSPPDSSPQATIEVMAEIRPGTANVPKEQASDAGDRSHRAVRLRQPKPSEPVPEHAIEIM